MKIEVPIKYKKHVKFLNYFFSIISVVMCFITLGKLVAVLITTLIIFLTYLLEKFIFVFNVLHVSHIPEIKASNDVKIGYGYKDNIPQIYILFKTKKDAESEYKYLKKINSNKINDTKNNIIINFVFFDNKKYALFIYGNNSREKFLETLKAVEFRAQKDEKPKLFVLNFWNVYPAIFSGKGDLKEILKKFINNDYFELTLGYLKNGEIVEIKKNNFKKYHLSIKNRNDLGENDLEYYYEWESI